MKTKVCTRCGKEKNETSYFKDCSKVDGLKSQCKLCIKTKKSNYDNGEKRIVIRVKRTIPEQVHKVGSKVCTFCKIEKEYKNYARNRATKDQYATRCKECDSKAHWKKKESEINYASFYYPVALD
jgi:hypothetical protein